MIIVLGMSKQEDFHLPEKPLEKTRKIDSETRISKKAKMKRKFSRSQKRITPWDIQLGSLTSLVSMILLYRRPDLFVVNHMIPRMRILVFTFRSQILLEHVYMRPEVNSNQFEISLRGKISLRCEVTSLSTFTWLRA